MLAAHRRTADAAGIDWKSAVYGKVGEEVSAGRRLTIERMVKLGGVSRSGFYRLGEDCKPDPEGSARRHPAHRVRVAQLRPATHHPGVAAAWMGGEREAGLPPAARGQPAVRAQAQVRG